MKNKIFCEKSFTLVETLVVVAILATLVTTAFIELSSYKVRHTFDLDSETIVEALMNAQSKAVQQENGQAWGVHFATANSQAQYQIFSGTVYNSSNVVTSDTLSSVSSFTDPAGTSTIDIVFSKLSGVPTIGAAAVIVIKQAGSSNVYSIFVGSNGKISKNLETGLIGYWPFDEGGGGTTFDASSYLNHRTITIGSGGSQTTATQARTNGSSGRVYTALNFDGTDDKIALANLSTNSSIGNYTSVSFWLYWGGTGNEGVFGFGSNYSLILLGSTTAIGFNTGNSGEVLGTSFGAGTYANKWTHVVAIFNNGVLNNCFLYINGVEKTLDQDIGAHNSTPVISSSANIAADGGGSLYFGGMIDDVRIYNRKLSDSEVLNLYNSY